MIVAIRCYGETLQHIDGRMGPGNYATLCGMDGDDDDPSVDQTIVEAIGKIDCPDCIRIWQVCRNVPVSAISRGKVSYGGEERVKHA